MYPRKVKKYHCCLHPSAARVNIFPNTFFSGKIPLLSPFNHVINAAIKVGLEEYNFLPFNNSSPQGGLNVLNNTAFTLEQGDTLSKISHLLLQLRHVIFARAEVNLDS